MKFPVPFSGISRIITCTSPEMLTGVVMALTTCPHDHNFAVQRDGGRVMVSAFAVKCLGDQGVRIDGGPVRP